MPDLTGNRGKAKACANHEYIRKQNKVGSIPGNVGFDAELIDVGGMAAELRDTADPAMLDGPLRFRAFPQSLIS